MNTQIEIEQGSEEWRFLRKSRITATDAPVILGLSPYKSIDQLMEEKLGPNETIDNEAMKRGRELEPIVREKFILTSQMIMKPSVHLGLPHPYPSIYSDFDSISDEWIMCSTDGISNDGKVVLEIKCGRKSYADAFTARKTKEKTLHPSHRIPDYYYAQIQHILACTGALLCFYMCYQSGFDITLPVQRNESFISNMLEKEYAFYLEMQARREVKC